LAGNKENFFSKKEKDLHPFPLHKLKRVDEPTVKITGNINRFDEREHAFNRALRGDLGVRSQEERTRFVAKYPLSASLYHVTSALKEMVEGLAALEKAPIPEDPQILTLHIKRLAYFLRADLVGVGIVPPYAVYSYDKEGKPVNLNHKYAIVILIDQDFDTFNASNGKDWISNSQSMLSYSTSALLACSIAEYIRRLGYPARAHHFLNYQVVVSPLLLWAGMGEMSRIGIVINPFLGPRFKASVVTTDLPLIPDKPIDFNLQEFCKKCMICAHECPSKAISTGDKVLYNGYETWKANSDSCVRFRLTNNRGSGCGRCIKVCPWNNKYSWWHYLTYIRGAQRSALFRKFLIWAHKNSGKPDVRDKWWFDLEIKDNKWLKR